MPFLPFNFVEKKNTSGKSKRMVERDLHTFYYIRSMVGGVYSNCKCQLMKPKIQLQRRPNPTEHNITFIHNDKWIDFVLSHTLWTIQSIKSVRLRWKLTWFGEGICVHLYSEAHWLYYTLPYLRRVITYSIVSLLVFLSLLIDLFLR